MISAGLFVDVLGVKQRWRHGGIESVTEACRVFEGLVEHSLRAAETEPCDGGIESDAAVLVFDRAVEAVRVGRELFRAAFERAVREPNARLWLRGVVSAFDPRQAAVNDSALSASFPSVQVRRYSADLLQAIHVEQSGTKGMRLLIDNELVDDRLSDDLKITIGERRYLVPLRTLDHSFYPSLGTDTTEPFSDVLWMVPDPIDHFDQWRERDRQASDFLRIAGRNNEEFAHVASTVLVFAEAGAILGSVGLLRKGGLPGTPGNSY